MGLLKKMKNKNNDKNRIFQIKKTLNIIENQRKNQEINLRNFLKN